MSARISPASFRIAGEVFPLSMNNIFEGIPGNREREIFEQLAAGECVKIERIVSKGQKSPVSGWYDQEENEWVMVLKGQAELSFPDGTSVRLGAGDFIDIPSHKKHKVDWTDPERETIWLAIHYR
uniref:Cupin 2 domain-containing protein n=1 Tax=Candidatus Kentrum sp. LPFa TaxID=2126335 RepID=A0A450X3M2_9GAMM|nr:MAG: cupin 2 domain-containing protein [Candidatus Kentron sp. LPFa]